MRVLHWERKGDFTTDFNVIKRMTRQYQNKLYVNILKIYEMEYMKWEKYNKYATSQD